MDQPFAADPLAALSGVPGKPENLSTGVEALSEVSQPDRV